MHNFKSVAGNLGLNRVAEVASELDSAIKQGLSKTHCSVLVDQCEHELKLTLNQIHELAQ